MKKLITILAVSVMSLSAFSQTISWAYLQWAASTTISQGEVFEAGAAVFADGLTNAVNSTTGEGIICELGYSSSNTDPSTSGWTWTSIPFNGDWGNNFYYQGSVSDIPAGTYFYNFRFKLGSADYKYAGTDGLWNGTSSINGSFTVISTTDLTQITEVYSISLLQNPVTNGIIKLKLNNPVSGSYSLRLVDSTGKLVMNKQFDEVASSLELNVGNQLKGMYFMQITGSDNNTSGFKVMIK